MSGGPYLKGRNFRLFRSSRLETNIRKAITRRRIIIKKKNESGDHPGQVKNDAQSDHFFSAGAHIDVVTFGRKKGKRSTEAFIGC